MDGTLTSFGLLAALAAVVIVASWTDVRQRRIPNTLCAATFILGVCYVSISAGWSEIGWALAHAGAALLASMVLFAAGAIGAGDAKFYAAMAAWLPISKGLLLLMAVALAGFVLLSLFLAIRLPGRAARKGKGRSQFDKLPYGVAIGLGGLAAVTLP